MGKRFFSILPKLGTSQRLTLGQSMQLGLPMGFGMGVGLTAGDATRVLLGWWSGVVSMLASGLAAAVAAYFVSIWQRRHGRSRQETQACPVFAYDLAREVDVTRESQGLGAEGPRVGSLGRRIMGKRFFAILGTVGLATGLVVGTGVRSASAAGEGHRSPPTSSAGHNDGARHDFHWEYYGCFYERCDAEDACRQLRPQGFQCKIERKNNRWCVYIRRNH
jgi:hypothetical protein